MQEHIFIEKALKLFNVENYCIFGMPTAQDNLFDNIKIVVGSDNTGTVQFEELVDNYPFTYNQLLDAVTTLEEEYASTEYQRLRQKEYPPITDYLDAIVKGDLEQQQTYIDACLAVKAKYPK